MVTATKKIGRDTDRDEHPPLRSTGSMCMCSSGSIGSSGTFLRCGRFVAHVVIPLDNMTRYTENHMRISRTVKPITRAHVPLGLNDVVVMVSHERHPFTRVLVPSLVRSVTNAF